MEGEEGQVEIGRGSKNGGVWEKGRRVWVRGGRIRIGNKWWRWDEEGEVLRDERGEARGEERGEGR